MLLDLGAGQNRGLGARTLDVGDDCGLAVLHGAAGDPQCDAPMSPTG